MKELDSFKALWFCFILQFKNPKKSFSFTNKCCCPNRCSTGPLPPTGIFFINYKFEIIRIYLMQAFKKNKVPTKITDCKAQIGNDTIIDLSILDNPRFPR